MNEAKSIHEAKTFFLSNSSGSLKCIKHNGVIQTEMNKEELEVDNFPDAVIFFETNKKQEHIGLLLGSFNPIHIGHLILAEMALEKCKLDAVWFIVSPLNPAKVKSGTLINEYDRLEMVELATKYNPKLHASMIEFALPRPSFTNNTLRLMRERMPDKKFSVVCGTDTHFKIPKWRNASEVISNHDFILHQRGGYAPKMCELLGIDKKTTLLTDVPTLDISSTFIRNQIKNDLTLKHLLPEEIIGYIKTKQLYKA